MVTQSPDRPWVGCDALLIKVVKFLILCNLFYKMKLYSTYIICLICLNRMSDFFYHGSILLRYCPLYISKKNVWQFGGWIYLHLHIKGKGTCCAELYFICRLPALQWICIIPKQAITIICLIVNTTQWRQWANKSSESTSKGTKLWMIGSWVI
jgi:hypothetical protein